MSILPPALSAAVHHGLIQSNKLEPLLHWNLWPLARTGAFNTCVARGSGGESRGESGGGEGLTSLSASLRSVRPQLRSRFSPLGQGDYWELLTPATCHLTLLTLALRELSLVQEPVAANPPFHHQPRVRNGQGKNKRGQGSSAGRFMSLWSSDSLLALRLCRNLSMLRMNDEFVKCSHVIFAACRCIDTVTRRKSYLHALVLAWYNLQDQRGVRTSAHLKI